MTHVLNRLLDETFPLAGLGGGNVHPLAHLPAHAWIEEVNVGKRERCLSSDLVDELDRDAAVLQNPATTFPFARFRQGMPNIFPCTTSGCRSVTEATSSSQLVFSFMGYALSCA